MFSSFFDSITSSWGDFWAQVGNGVVQIATISWETVTNGVKSTVVFVVDNAIKVWEGVASFVGQVCGPGTA
jgi:hypothetical protein